MKRILYTAGVICALFSLQASHAQVQFGWVSPNQPQTQLQTRYGGPIYNPYGYPGISPYTTPYFNPYALPYTLNYGTVIPGVGMTVPSFGSPQALGGGYFGISSGGTTFRVWQAPSGYYYPWCGTYSLGYRAPIIYLAPGESSPTPAKPPLSTIFSDLDKFLEESKQNNKLSLVDYNHLKLRANDLKNKERSLRIGGGGSFDSWAEEDLRKDIDQLNEEIARRVRQ